MGRTGGLLLGLTVTAAALTVLTLLTESGQPTSPPRAPGPGPAGPPSPVPYADQAGITYQDLGFGTETTAPTGTKSQSKLWLRGRDWWAVLLDPITGQYRIHRLDWASQQWIDSGIVVDDRASSRQDVLAAGDALFIVSAGTKERPADRTFLWRYTYEASSGRYRLDPDFPVTLTPLGARSLTLARDAEDRIWIAYISGDRLLVNSSEPAGHQIWGEAFTPPVEGTRVAADEAAIVAYRDRVGIVWSNQNEDAVYFASHRAGDPRDVWQETSTGVEGLDIADDHINVRVLDTPTGARLFVAAKTSLDTAKPHVNPLDPQMLLLVLDEDGSWRKYLYGRVSDRHTRPIVLIDGDRKLLYLFAVSPFGGGNVYVKHTPVDDISFEPGLGSLFMTSETELMINTPTSTKQNVDATTGIVVLASDDTSDRYVHGILPLARALPEAPATRAPVAAQESKPGPIDIVNARFEGLPSGPVDPGVWALPKEGGSSLEIRAGRGGRLAALSTMSVGHRARACRVFQVMSSGVVRATVAVARPGITSGDASLLSVRSAGVELATVRFGRGQEFVFFDGQRRVASGVAYRPARWYRATVVLDTARRQYSLEIRDDPTDRLLLRRDRIAWRDGTRPGPDRVCIETGDGAVSEALLFDDLQVGAQP